MVEQCNMYLYEEADVFNPITDPFQCVICWMNSKGTDSCTDLGVT